VISENGNIEKRRGLNANPGTNIIYVNIKRNRTDNDFLSNLFKKINFFIFQKGIIVLNIVNIPNIPYE
tara:strand:+ start:236 stop:439 length:204 start_codon:yes stop_codon:yes gene_type:complete